MPQLASYQIRFHLLALQSVALFRRAEASAVRQQQLLDASQDTLVECLAALHTLPLEACKCTLAQKHPVQQAASSCQRHSPHAGHIFLQLSSSVA